MKARGASKPSFVIIVTNMEPMKLEICLMPKRIKDFWNAHLFHFLYLSYHLPSINMSLVEEYIINYDPKDGSSVVQGRIIEIDGTILERVLFLPIGEIAIGVDDSSDFSSGRYFKGGMLVFKRSQGWRIAKVILPKLVDSSILL